MAEWSGPHRHREPPRGAWRSRFWIASLPLVGRRRPKGISRQGDSRLRKLFALGASTVLRNARAPGARATPWQRGILARRPLKVAVLAQAAKTARIAWAVLTSGEVYQPQRQASTIAAA